MTDDEYFVVLQRQIVSGAPRWVSVAAGFRSAAAAAKYARRYKGWVWWGPADQARRIEAGEEQVPS